MKTLLLALTIAIAGAHAPQDAVKRFLQPRNARDACAQLAPAYRKQIEAQYGPCVAGVAKNPKATHLVISDVVVHGNEAALQADYSVPSGPITEHFTLVQRHHIWLITSAR